ncbi:hypothetical protein Q1695_011255 [Nippostrongylus brasiliensis]|nr:hypothetical protein Q1695_011255 [Nippostrongylus brasiliensis]
MKSELVRLIVEQIHRQNAHCGKEHTLAIARLRFWIPRASNAFKRYIKHCPVCKRHQGLPLGAPDMPPLPADRVVECKPFQNTGCDFMGPFTSKTQEKMYIALYTCLTTRAVHLEVVENMSTGAFLSSFIRFISRRGVPKLIRTDCGTNFKHGEQIIATMFEHDETTGHSLMSYSAAEKIKWLFNPPAAPWMGGVWERLVGSVKKALNKSIGRKRLSFTEMCTITARIEAVLNTRPLTKLNMGDIEEIPLRPIDFLQGNVRFSLTDISDDGANEDPTYNPEFIQTREQAMEAIRYSENCANKFWECWKSEYLLLLREMQKQTLKQPRHTKRSCPELGEVVLIEQDLIPRGCWPYGKVVEIIPSQDGLVRSAKILMPNHRVIQRPLNKIYPLEIRSIDEKPAGEIPTDKDVTTSNDTRREKLPRSSKERALDFFRNMESDTHVSHSRPSPAGAKFFALIAILSVVAPTRGANPPKLSSISCANGVISVPPINSWFELCIDSECRSMMGTTRTLTYLLPVSPTEHGAKVILKTLTENGIRELSRNCDSPKFCDHQHLLSKSLLGNPHCWPAGAIITAAITIYLIVAAILVISWATAKLIKHYKTKARTNTRRSTGNQRTRETSAPSFELTPLSGTTLTMCTLLCIIASATACQHGYVRHSAEMVCNEHHRCHLEYSRELLFNRLQSEICLEVLHANRTIGLIKFRKRSVEYKCSKVTEFFTRPTKTHVYHVKRCPEAGSCTTEKCETISPNEIVPELQFTAKYPGYSGCLSSCGGILCGCLMPLPSCWFYRVIHKPESARVYEVIHCNHWTPTVKLDVEITIANDTRFLNHSFVPYVTETLGNLNVTVASIQKPSESLDGKRFAVSGNQSYLLPPNYQLPVACSSHNQAKNEFSTCHNRIRCRCENSVQNCQWCPEDSIHLLQETEHGLPVQTPYININSIEDDIVANSNNEELVLRVESIILHDTAEIVADQDCAIKVLELTGCYDCDIGAHLTASCKSPIHAVATVTCESHQFVINCGPANETNNITLYFEHPTVYEQCNLHCAEKPTPFLVDGTLRYHMPRPNGSIFDAETHHVPLRHQWVMNFSLPNIDPLINTIKSHWELAAGAIGSIAFLAIATYLAGPVVILLLIRAIGSMATTITSSLWRLIASLVNNRQGPPERQ